MFDVLIQNANIIDGSGKPGFHGDVAVQNGKIAAVGQLDSAAARKVLDAAGRTLTPGFLDIHRHGDGALFRPGYGEAEIRQGLTTVVNGNCGLSMAPVNGAYADDLRDYLLPITGSAPDGVDCSSVASYLDAVQQVQLPLNNGFLVGMGTLRADIAGLGDGELTDEQYRQLHHAMETALSDGALGVSLGLGYAPECYYQTKGLIRALEPLANTNIPVTVHMRQEGDGVVEALEEMLTVAKTLHLRLEVSHLKAIGRHNWRSAVPQMLAMLEAARADGLDVACDFYPYPAGSTQLIHVLPTEYQADPMTALQDPEERKHIRHRIETGRDFENIIHLSGFDLVLATGLHQPENLALEGKSIQEIAELQGKDPFDALFDLLVSEHCGASMIDFIASEEDMEDILRKDFSSVISDSTYPTSGLYHPRVYGTFPRLIERFVYGKKTIPLEAAVRKMTSLPASRLGLTQKGQIRVGADADLCLFDPEQLKEQGTWQKPDTFASGMDWVFVDGQPVLADGVLTDAKPGHCLRK